MCYIFLKCGVFGSEARFGHCQQVVAHKNLWQSLEDCYAVLHWIVLEDNQTPPTVCLEAWDAAYSSSTPRWSSGNMLRVAKSWVREVWASSRKSLAFPVRPNRAFALLMSSCSRHNRLGILSGLVLLTFFPVFCTFLYRWMLSYSRSRIISATDRNR